MISPAGYGELDEFFYPTVPVMFPVLLGFLYKEEDGCLHVILIRLGVGEDDDRLTGSCHPAPDRTDAGEKDDPGRKPGIFAVR
jgi:hypothetical protein